MSEIIFSHVDHGLPRMVDVSHKSPSVREASAVATLSLPAFVTDLIDDGELLSKKGPVFATAIIAGVMAAKNTSSLIPFCHALMLDDVKISITTKSAGLIEIKSTIKSCGRTGVEMEALTSATITALTIYDMCKSVTLDIKITEVKLLKKSGGKSEWRSS